MSFLALSCCQGRVEGIPGSEAAEPNVASQRSTVEREKRTLAALADFEVQIQACLFQPRVGSGRWLLDAQSSQPPCLRKQAAAVASSIEPSV